MEDIIWKQYECNYCGLNFMIKQDQEHDEKNTNCPECRRVVRMVLKRT